MHGNETPKKKTKNKNKRVPRKTETTEDDRLLWYIIVYSLQVCRMEETYNVFPSSIARLLCRSVINNILQQNINRVKLVEHIYTVILTGRPYKTRLYRKPIQGIFSYSEILAKG